MHSQSGILGETPDGAHNNETDAVARAYGPGQKCEAKAGEVSAAAEIKKTLVCLTLVKSKQGGDHVLLVLHFAIPGKRFEDEGKRDPMNDPSNDSMELTRIDVCGVLVCWRLKNQNRSSVSLCLTRPSFTSSFSLISSPSGFIPNTLTPIGDHTVHTVDAMGRCLVWDPRRLEWSMEGAAKAAGWGALRGGVQGAWAGRYGGLKGVAIGGGVGAARGALTGGLRYTAKEGWSSAGKYMSRYY